MSLVVPWWAGCSQAAALKVGIHPWVGYETLELASEFKWLGTGVELVRTADLSASALALRAGQVDAACLTLDEVLHLRSLDVPVTMGLVFDVSAGADALLVRPGIERLADLSGKRVGVESGALGVLMLDGVLKTAGLAASAVQVLELPPERQLTAWRQREVDALVCYEPTATLLQREGARRLFDSRQMPDVILDVLAVRSDRVSGRNAQIRELVSAHFRGLKHLQVSRQDAVYRIAQRQKMTPQEVGQGLAGVYLPTLEANRQYLAPAGRLQSAAQTVSSLLVSSGLLKRAVDLTDIGNAQWLPHDD